MIEGDEIPNVQDEIPILAVAAAFADGVTEVRDAAELTAEGEQPDRRACTRSCPSSGSRSRPGPTGSSIRGGVPRPALLKSHGDHRMAMALAVFAANAIDGESTVRGWQAVSSSYPEFADDLARLTGAK